MPSELFEILGEVKYANGYSARVMLCEKTGEQYSVVCKDGEPFPDHYEHAIEAMHEARKLAGALGEPSGEETETVILTESE